jgi:hypothetical protein
MFSQFNTNADAIKPLGVVMLQHELLQGEKITYSAVTNAHDAPSIHPSIVFDQPSPNPCIVCRGSLSPALAGSVNAVQTFIAGAKARGYTLVSIYECIWGPNYQRHPSWVYAHRNCGSTNPAWPSNTGAEPCPLSDWCVVPGHR